MPTYDELQAKVRNLCESAQWSEIEVASKTLPLGLVVEVAQMLARRNANEINQFNQLSRLMEAAKLVSPSTVYDLAKFGDASAPSMLFAFGSIPGGMPPSGSISKDGAYIALPIGEVVHIFETSSNKQVSAIELSGICVGTALSSSGKVLLAVEQSKIETNKLNPLLFDSLSGAKLGELNVPRPLNSAFTQTLLLSTLLMPLYSRGPLPVCFTSDDRLLLMQAKNKLQTYDCADGELIHQFPTPDGAMQAPVIADSHIVVGQENKVSFFTMPFGSVAKEVGIKGQFVNYANEVFLSSDHSTVHVATTSGALLRSFKVSQSGANFESSSDCKYVCDRLQSTSNLTFYKSEDGSKTSIQLDADDKSTNGYALMLAGATGLGIIAPEALWFCPYALRTSTSKWKPAVTGIAHELISRCGETEFKTIDQILERDSFSAEERSYLRLMQAVLKVHAEADGATDGFVLSLKSGKVTPKEEPTAPPEKEVVDFSPEARHKPEAQDKPQADDRTKPQTKPEPPREPESKPAQKPPPQHVESRPSAKPQFKNAHKLPSHADLADILATNPDESKAWGWVPFVSPISARDILRHLRKREWYPEHESHRQAYRKVQKLARDCRGIAGIVAEERALSKLVCRAEESFDMDNNDRDSRPVARVLCEVSNNWLITFALMGDPFPVRLWSLRDGKTHKHLNLPPGTNFILGMGLNQHGNLLAVEYCSKATATPPVPGVDKAKIMICSIPEMELAKVLEPEQELVGVHSPIFSPDSKLLYAVNEKTIRVWDTQSWTLKQTLPILPQSEGAHAFIYDLSIDFESGQFTAIVSTYDANSFSVQLRRLSDGSLISSASLPPTSSRLAVTNLLKDKVLTISGPRLSLWKLPKMQHLSSWIPPRFHDGQYATRAVSQDGDWLAIAKVNDESTRTSPQKIDSEILIVRLSDWKVVETLTGPFNDVLALKFSTGDNKLYAGTSNGVWEFVAPKSSDTNWQALLERLVRTPLYAMAENEVQEVNSALSSTWLDFEHKSWIRFIIALKDLS